MVVLSYIASCSFIIFFDFFKSIYLFIFVL